MVLYPRIRAQKKYARVKRRIFRRKARRVLRRAGNSGLARRVRAIVNGMEETKQKTTTYKLTFNSGITSAAEMYNIIPNIPQGVGDAQRVGQKIQPKYLKIRCIMSYGTGGSNVQPIHPQMFCLIDKNQKNSNLGFSTAAFLNNSGTDVTYDGTWSTAKLPVNTENFKLVKRRTFRLAYNTLPGGSATTVTEPVVIWKEYSFTVPLYKYAKYFDYDSSGNNPINFNLGIGFGYHRLDDTTDLVGTPLTVMFQSTMYYKDS